MSEPPGPLVQAKQAVRRALRHGKYVIGDRPSLLPVLLRLTPEGTSRAITAETQLVIEGFPRSGNTFAVFAFRSAQGAAVQVVSHVHHPAQVIAAVRRDVPTLVVIRRPVPCLASYLVHSPHGRPAGVLKEYVHYHRMLLPHRRGFVVGEFDEVTTSFSDVIDRVNRRFGTSFAPFDQGSINVEQIFRDIDEYHSRAHPRMDPARVVPRPSETRARENHAYRTQLDAPENATLLATAEHLYDELAET